MSDPGPAPTIAIDGVFFQLGNSGVAHFWRALLAEWSDCGFARHLVVFDRNGTAPRMPGLRYRAVPAHDYARSGQDALVLQAACDDEGAELFASTYYTAPLTTPSVFMAYDMIPEVLGADLNEPMWREKHNAVRHASAFMAISHSTARDLADRFPRVRRDAITVAHCGARDCFRPAGEGEVEHFRRRFGIDRPYFLLVGERMGVGGYKNAKLLFQAHQSSPRPRDHLIVCVGGRGELEPELRALASPDDYRLLDLTDDELRTAYGGALALAYPSRYEGFGMPVVEAMKCGCPVITCRNSSITEVAGSAALFVPEDGVGELVAAMRSVQDAATRRRMVADGLANARRFNWADTANRVADALRGAINGLRSGDLRPPAASWPAFRRLQSRRQELRAELAPARSLLRWHAGRWADGPAAPEPSLPVQAA